MLTKSDLTAAVNRLDGALRVWLGDDRHDCTYRGKPAKSLPPSIVADLEQLFAMVSTSDVEPAGYALALALDDVRRAYDEWCLGRQTKPEVTEPSAPGVVAKWQAVISATKDKPRQEPPVIKSLVRQGVPLEQIARIFGWRDSEGLGDVEKLREEIAEPGRHLDLNTWKSPKELQRQRDLAKLWAKRTTPKTHADIKAADQPRRTVAERKPASESVLELAAMNGMRPAQLCKMKAIDIDTLAVELSRHGLVIAEVGTPSARKVFQDRQEQQRVESVLGTGKRKQSRARATAIA